MKDSEYKKLLMEALGRVDEKLSVNVNPRQKLKSKYFLKPAWNDETPAAKAKADDYKKAAMDVADNSIKHNYITDEDFYNAYVGDDKGEIDAADKVISVLKQDYEDLALAAKDLADLAKQAGETTPIEKELKTALNPSNTGAYVADDVSAPAGSGERDLSADQFGTPDLSRGSYADTSTTVWTDFSKFKITADSSIINQFNTIDGDNLLDMFESLKEFGGALKDKNTVNAWIQNNAPNGQYKFMNYASAFITLADMGKRLSGNEAGYEFEKYLALLLGSPVVGGDNGAVDNISSLAGDNPVYLSAKMYGTKGSIKQAIGKPKSDKGTGMQAILKDSGQKIYFLSIIKGTASDNYSQEGTGYSTLYLYITETAYDDRIGYYGRNIAKDGTPSKPYRLKEKAGDLYLFAGEGASYSKPADAAFVIPVLTVNTNLTQLTAQRVAEVVDTSTQKTVGHIQNVYKRLINLKMNTRDYVADRGSKDPGNTIANAKKYVDAIRHDYNELKGDWNNIFSGDQKGTSGLTMEKIDIKDIKKLTEEILKEMLKEDE